MTRDVHQVYDDLNELARLNLIEFEDWSQAKRPVVWYDDIDIEIPITDEDQSAAPAGLRGGTHGRPLGVVRNWSD